MTYGRKKICAVELDGQLFSYENDRLAPIEDLDDLRGNRFLISDLKEGIAKTMTVEAPVRFVELMVRRRLQEAGEFEEPVTVLTHWKRARGKNTTDIFFTAIPSRLSHYYTEQMAEGLHAVMVFPIYSVLFHVVKRLRSSKAVALVFQHGRFADLLIASSRRVYYAIRCTAFDATREQLLALWESVLAEIHMVEKEQRIKITKVHAMDWIDSGPLPNWDEKAGIELIALPSKELVLEPAALSTSFFTATSNLPVFQSISSLKEKIFFKAAAWAPALILIVLLTALGLFGAGFYLSGHSKALAEHVEDLTQQYARTRMEMPVLSSAVAYRSTLDFVKELAEIRAMPDYKTVIADLSEAMSIGMQLDVLKLTYSATEVQLELFGPIRLPFDQAHEGYQRFLKITAQKGYQIIESRFDTVIDQSKIQIRMVKRWA